ncbi:MAG TPA: hypothetical protein VM368_08530, partial [Flavisolibacter sp.]|nr:hypothetical protein [Flavisolibacter sp.]
MTKFSLRLQLLTLCLFFFCCVFSQSLKLTGKVVNERKEAVSGASVQVNGASGVATNIDGIYMLSLI